LYRRIPLEFYDMGGQVSKEDLKGPSNAAGDINIGMAVFEKEVHDPAAKAIPLDINVPLTTASDASHVDEGLGEVADVTNPVSLEHFHLRSKDIFPSTFQGVRFALQKPFSQHFQGSHTLVLDGKESAYRMGVTYVGTKQISESEMFPVLTAELSGQGNLQAQIVHQFSQHWKARYLSQINPQAVAHQQLALEWTRGRWLGGFTLVNPSPDFSRFIGVTDTSCQLTRSICVGNQFLLQGSPVIPGGIVGSWTMGLRINSSDKVALSDAPFGAGIRPHRAAQQSKWQIAVTGSPLSLSLNTTFAVRVSSQLQLASEIEINMRQQAAVASIGYQYDLPQSNTTIKSQVDQQLNVQTTLEKRLLPLPFLLSLSARGNPMMGKYSLGIGLTMD
jgi:mitochondrial import receptor subunit TOM40